MSWVMQDLEEKGQLRVAEALKTVQMGFQADR
jgi:hypothetical protein